MLKIKRSARRWMVLSAAVGMVISPAFDAMRARAATLYWDADGTASGNGINTINSAGTGVGLGGTGLWDTTSSLWWDGTNPDMVWANTTGDTAIFAGNAGLVTLNSPVNVGTIQFGT